MIDFCGDRVVVTEPSDSVATVPYDAAVRLPVHVGGGRWPIPARSLCEPRVVYLGKTGRATQRATYFLARNSFKFDVVAYLDVDVRGAVPEPHPMSS